MTARPTCFVIGNCTHRPIQTYLNATGLFSAVDGTALFSVKRDKFAETYARVKHYDYVFSLAHGAAWGEFSAPAMKADLGERLVLFASPFFTGLHPDVIYVADGAARAQSLLGDYHSGLVYWGYMAGKPVEEIIDMYHAAVLPAFFELENSWDAGLKELQLRDQSYDIATAGIFDRLCRQRPAMLTINHPSMDIIAEICHMLCAKILGDTGVENFDHGSVYHVLTTNVAIPVSPAATRVFQLPYQSMPTFKCRPLPNGKEVYLNFAEFARLSYQDYAAQNTSAFRAATPSGLAARLNQALGKA